MTRLEGPTKAEAIRGLIDILDRIGLRLGVPIPAIHTGMWYNIDRNGIDQLKEFLLIVEKTLIREGWPSRTEALTKEKQHALDSSGRLPSHQEGSNPAGSEPMGEDRK